MFSLHLCHGLLVGKAKGILGLCLLAGVRCSLSATGLFSRACDMRMVSLLPPPSLDLCHAYPRCCNVHLKVFVNPTSCKALPTERNPKSPRKSLECAVVLGAFLISEF